MISFETDKALQDAGLKWEPQLGDLFVADYNNGLGPTPVDVVKTDNFGDPGPEHIWIPRLDQLLVEIEKRGYRYRLDSNPDDETNKFYTPTVELLVKDEKCKFRWWVAFADCADSPEEAAAQALLWVLEKEGSAMPG